MINFFCSIFEKIPKLMIPAFWFAQTIDLNEELSKKAKVYFDYLSIESEFYCEIYFIDSVRAPVLWHLCCYCNFRHFSNSITIWHCTHMYKIMGC